MDFFAQQHRARRNTTLMVVLFVLAVLAIVFAVDLLAAAAWLALAYDTMLDKRAGLLGQVPAPVYWAGTLAALGTIAGGTLYRIVALSKGGVAVARMVGARWVRRNSEDPLERRLLNIVEEMAIASGITMPAVFVMDDEKNINAFASGYSPNEAAVTVTRGALEHLDRDELQGVIGHEFSHILNGDMRLNIWLLGVIAGIVLIGSAGRFLLTIGRGGGDSRQRGDIRFFFLGLALWLVGWIGVFFGRVIKAAVSREREYLADAASVQFTRNPQGIGGALYKIGQSSGGIANRYAEELSHMYFSASVGRAFLSLLDTHPPIEDRIKRVLGDRGLLFIRSQAKKTGADIPREGAPQGTFPAGADDALVAAAATTGLEWGRRAGDESIRTSSDAVMDSVGRPTTLHIDYARRMLQDLPESVRRAMESADGPPAVLYALLVAPGGEACDTQVAMIAGSAGDATAEQTLALAQALKPLGERARLPVLDLVIPALKVRPQAEREKLLDLVMELIEADRRVSVFEFVLITICRRQFGSERRSATVKYRTVQSVSNQIAVVLSLLIHAGRGRPDMFEGAMNRLGLTGQKLRTPAEVGYKEVEAALRELELLAPLVKPVLIKACLAVVVPEGEISIVQAELMRAVCAALDTPLPPILDA